MVNFIQFIDHPADIAVRVKGQTLEELFNNAARAWLISALDSPQLKSSGIMEFDIEADSCEELLIQFLNELNYFLYVQSRVPTDFKLIEISGTREAPPLSLKAVVSVCSLDSSSVFKTEIKAVTFHQADISFSDGLYSTIIVFDI